MEQQGLRAYEGAVAIVTGAASGLGRALSMELAWSGAEIVLADVQIDAAREAAKEINRAGGKATAAELDVRDFAAVDRLVKETAERTGRLDYMFNNAGIAIGGFCHRFQIEDWHQMLDVNLKGVINGMHATYPFMLKQGFGHIVNTGSVAGLIPGPAAYSATKFGIVGVSLSLRTEAEPRNVRVSVVCPGAIRSAMIDGGGKFGKNYDVPDDIMEEYWKQYNPTDPDFMARDVLKKVAKNEAVIFSPGYWAIFWWIYRLVPSFTAKVGKKRYADILEKLKARGINVYE